MPQIGATMRGYASEDEAREMAQLVLGYLRVLGADFDLERLHALTVAFDYGDAVAQVDRGGFKTVMKPTEDDVAVGVAMAVPILVDGKPFTHLVLNAGLMSLLKEDGNPDLLSTALHILVHEAAHVHDLAIQNRAYPGMFGTAIRDLRDATLFTVAQTCWEEYIASLLSAGYAPAERTEQFDSAFCKTLRGVRGRGNEIIKKYRLHSDIDRLVSELVGEYRTALKYGAYLLGHLDGLDATFSDAAPESEAAICDLEWFAPLFDQFWKDLKHSHQMYGRWPGLHVFDPLKATLEDVLKIAGIEFQPRPGGNCHIAVPFTPDTIPL
jgi:hypothetical protein